MVPTQSCKEEHRYEAEALRHWRPVVRVELGTLALQGGLRLEDPVGEMLGGVVAGIAFCVSA